jgi:1-acyl-sn-glycerol-3-phosphate acyltransferase
MKRLGIVTIDRSSGRDSIGGINMAVEKLRSGMPVFTFPEGTRTKDGKVAKFKRGSFKLALESQASIVPIGISGSYEAPRRIGTIKINFGQPIEYDEYKHLSDIELADLIRQKVIELSFQKKESNHGTV